MATSKAERGFQAFQVELHRERAGALGRYGRRLAEAWATCQARLHEVDRRGADDPSRPAALAAYREAVADYELARWKLAVQREAVRLLDHRWVDRTYPPPPKR